MTRDQRCHKNMHEKLKSFMHICCCFLNEAAPLISSTINSSLEHHCGEKVLIESKHSKSVETEFCAVNWFVILILSRGMGSVFQLPIIDAINHGDCDHYYHEPDSERC